MYTAVLHSGVNFRVRIRWEPSQIAAVGSKSISGLASSVDLPLYCNPCCVRSYINFVWLRVYCTENNPYLEHRRNRESE